MFLVVGAQTEEEEARGGPGRCMRVHAGLA